MDTQLNTLTEKLMREAGYAAPELASRAKILTRLIVEECIEVCMSSSYRNDDMGAILANKIRKKFDHEIR